MNDFKKINKSLSELDKMIEKILDKGSTIIYDDSLEPLLSMKTNDSNPFQYYSARNVSKRIDVNDIYDIYGSPKEKKDIIFQEEPEKRVIDWKPKKLTIRKVVYGYDPNESRYVKAKVLDMKFEGEICTYLLRSAQRDFSTSRVLKKVVK